MSARKALAAVAYVLLVLAGLWAAFWLMAVVEHAQAQTALEWAVAQAVPRQPGKAARGRPAPAGGRVVLASWYGGGEALSRYTANGEVFRPRALTAAHRSLPFGTRVAVSHGSRTVIVRINDRGPSRHTGRSLDLSKGAAVALGIAARGTAPVRIAVLGD